MRDAWSLYQKYKRYHRIPAAVRAWVSMDADKDGKSRTMVHAGIKAAFVRWDNLIHKK